MCSPSKLTEVMLTEGGALHRRQYQHPKTTSCANEQHAQPHGVWRDGALWTWPGCGWQVAYEGSFGYQDPIEKGNRRGM